MVDVAVREENGPDWRMALAGPGVQGHGSADLMPDVGRGVHHEPLITIRRDCKAGLGAGSDPRITCPGQTTDRAATIPLGNPAARCRTKNDRLHGRIRATCFPAR